MSALHVLLLLHGSCKAAEHVAYLSSVATAVPVAVCDLQRLVLHCLLL